MTTLNKINQRSAFLHTLNLGLSQMHKTASGVMFPQHYEKDKDMGKIKLLLSLRLCSYEAYIFCFKCWMMLFVDKLLSSG